MKYPLDLNDDHAQRPADSDIEMLLSEAYTVPPVPKSLQKRLDRMVAQHWSAPPTARQPDQTEGAPLQGGSLQGGSAKGSRGAGRSPARWTVWPVAVALAASLLLVASMWGDRRAYGWSRMVDALSRQQIIQVAEANSPTDHRWLSVSAAALGRQSADSAEWIDFRRRVSWSHQQTESHVLRSHLLPTATASDERMILSLLLGQSSGNGARRAEASGDVAGRLPKLTVVAERWQREESRIRLDVELRASQPLESTLIARLWLDPETHLPLKCEIEHPDGTLRRLAFSYPETTVEAVAARLIPADLPVVDAAAQATLSQSRALGPGHDSSTAEASPPDDSAAVASNHAGSPLDASVSPAEGAVGDPPAGETETSTAAPAEVLSGAASLDWTPVPKVDLPPEEVVRRVDATLERLWLKEKLEPAEPAGDEELLRRVYLDLAGRTPTVHEIRSYMHDESPDRYRRLVDRLLASADHATHLATVWRKMLLPEGTDLSQFGGVQSFDRWLSEQFRKNEPYDSLVRQLLLAEGRLAASGPLLFYAALKLDADQLAAKSSRVFLGMRLECAQCHDDPFEPWTQEDFWSYAAFFARISRPKAELAAVSTVMRVRDTNRGEVTLPDSDQVVAPQLLDASEWNESPESASRRHQLARWITAPENPYFAKAAVNRVWAHMFGRGIVDPVDGFGQQNKAVSPQLLELLAGQFIHQQFDLRETFRTVALSRAYRLSSGSRTPDPRRQEWFAQQNVKILTAEQLYDCIRVATLLGQDDSGEFTLARLEDTARSEFLQQFLTLSGNRTEYQNGIPQALTLMNGDLIASATGLSSSGLLKSLEAPFFTDPERVEVVYLATLSRQPTAAERRMVDEYLEGRDAGVSVMAPLADVLWALLNSAEFTMNH